MRDILITNTIVKMILAGAVSTNDVKTWRIDSHAHSFGTLHTNTTISMCLDVRLVGLILISVILCLISD